MVPWHHVDTARLPDGEELRLWRRGSEFSIRAGVNELMNSRLSGSEEMLARLACERLADRSRPEILIGGLGMGFTLRAALAALAEDARVGVAELVPEVIGWATGPLRSLFGGALEDPRVTIREADVAVAIRSGSAQFDAILLDVDNGPDGLTVPGNDALYGLPGLSAARAALRPRGVLAIWSARPDRAFTRRLLAAGFAVEEVGAKARGSAGGARHVIWIATAPAAR